MGSVRTGERKEALAKTTRRLQIALGEWQQQSSKRCRSAEVQQCSSAEAGAETHTQAGPPRRAFSLRFTSGGGRSRTSAGAGAGQAREMQGEEKVDTHQPSQVQTRPREKKEEEEKKKRKKRFGQRAWRKSRGGPKIWDSQRRASDQRAAGPGPSLGPNLHQLCTALPNLHGGGTCRARQKKKKTCRPPARLAGRPSFGWIRLAPRPSGHGGALVASLFCPSATPTPQLQCSSQRVGPWPLTHTRRSGETRSLARSS